MIGVVIIPSWFGQITISPVITHPPLERWLGGGLA